MSYTDPSARRTLWDKFYTEAPRPRTQSEQQYSDRKLRSRSHPNAEVEVHCDLSVNLLKNLHKREIDLALITNQAATACPLCRKFASPYTGATDNATRSLISSVISSFSFWHSNSGRPRQPIQAQTVTFIT